MNFAKIAAIGGLSLLGACSVLETLGTGFARLGDELEGQPDIYVGYRVVTQVREIEFTRYHIDRITLVQDREGVAPDVVFEGFIRVLKDDFSTEFPGSFRGMSLRADNARLAMVLVEEIGDTVEYNAVVLTTPGGRSVLGVSDNAVASDAFDLCFDEGAAVTALNARLGRTDGFDPDQPYEVVWGGDAFGGSSGEWPVGFTGWSAAGDAVFQLTAQFDATVTQGGKVILNRQGISSTRGLRRIAYSAETGDPVSCFEGEVVDPGPRAYQVRQEQLGAATAFDIRPFQGSLSPLYMYPSARPPQRLIVVGQVDQVAIPAAR